MMHSTIVCAFLAAAHAPAVSAFVPSGALGLTSRSSRYAPPRRSRSPRDMFPHRRNTGRSTLSQEESPRRT